MCAHPGKSGQLAYISSTEEVLCGINGDCWGNEDQPCNEIRVSTQVGGQSGNEAVKKAMGREMERAIGVLWRGPQMYGH